jgi:phosphopantothenoylcysteine decarboxylase/phosphopantothenate--cysteine ligase
VSTPEAGAPGSGGGPGVDDAAQGRKVLHCVTGGIAAYKAVEVARTLTQLGADVHVLMTASAQRFVTPLTFAAVSRNRVTTEVFDDSPEVAHVELARGADLAVVAPATANGLARLAHGLADDAFSATMLMARCPVLLAPAMHREMWEHPATAANVATLRERGATVLGPARGALISGDEGPGRMVEPHAITEAALGLLARAASLAGRRVVVTAGGTQELIDPVRFIGNRSSGLMGFAIAEEAAARGAKVTLVAGATSAPPPGPVDLVRVRSAAEMREAVLAAAPDADVIVKAAAVADFRPEGAADRKLKKAAGPPELRLVPTPDILAELGHSPALRKPGAMIVGFAAETEADPDRLGAVALEKLRAKGADVIVANDVASSDSGFGTRTNRAVIATAAGVRDLGLVSKRALAAALLDEVAARLGGQG